MHSVLISHPTYVNFNFSNKITDHLKNATYVQYLTALTPIMNPPSNPKNHDATPSAIQDDQINQTTTFSTKDSSPIYERRIAHATEIKFINNRYVTPVTVELGSSDSENSVNLPVKYRKLFLVLKILDPSLSITINDTTFNHPGEFSMGTSYTENVEVIVDKKPRYPRFFVHHEINSKIKLTALKFGDHNIMSTLQSLNTSLNLNRFSTHREASIGFIKYVSTGLILHHIPKKTSSYSTHEGEAFSRRYHHTPKN